MKTTPLTVNNRAPSRLGARWSASEPAQALRNNGGRPITIPRIAVAGFQPVSSPTSHTNTNRLVPNTVADNTLATSRARNAGIRSKPPTPGRRFVDSVVLAISAW
ncbi:MAG: hypothetical protein KDB37_00775 [Ilumatobacter sp.]|nr:hypothetical protein [Ilumatobacter sp.]